MIYSKGSYSIYEVDGEEHQVCLAIHFTPWRISPLICAAQLYAQNLSLFAKLFLDNKSVFFDVDGFYYYLLVRTPEPMAGNAPLQPHDIVGFFSKEKMSWDNNNLACILIFPPWQRQGIVTILMVAIASISKQEGQIGGPEKPLSELGKKGYYKFWGARLARGILGMKSKRSLTMQDIASRCWLATEDAIEALQDMDVLESRNTKSNANSVISKARVKLWVRNNHIDLADPVEEKDFVMEAMRSRLTEDA